MDNYIPEFSYENCFWENVDCLYEHSKLKYEEFMSLGDLIYNLSDSIKSFYKSLISVKSFYKPYRENDSSSRGKAINAVLDFMNKLIKNLEELSKNLLRISDQINEKKFSYESRQVAKKICDNNFKNYENNLKILDIKKNSYYDSINQLIEKHLNNIYSNKKERKNSDLQIGSYEKKKIEYLEQLVKTEQYRIEYVEIQRNIFSSEEEFEKECAGEIKSYLKKIISYYQDFLKKGEITNDIIDALEDINGIKDSQIFSEKHRTILCCPARIKFIEYTQDVENYINTEIVKNTLKNKTKEEAKEIQNKINTEVKNFLKDLLKQDNKCSEKFEEIANNILNNKLEEEDFNYLMKEFQKSYDNYRDWVKENVGLLEFKKVGETYDNRFMSMQMLLDAFNKARTHKKELNEKNFKYLTKAMEKILELNDHEDIDYKICELLITLASTFFTVEINNGKEEKKYATEIIKNSPLIQKVGFWVGLTKYAFNEEMSKEKDSNKDLNINKGIFNFLNRKKKEELNEIEEGDKIDKNIIAKLMSISYNLVQFIIDSYTLNNILANIFRAFKINKEKKEMVIEMMKFHMETEGVKNLHIDIDMLLKCDKIEYNNNSKKQRRVDFKLKKI